MTYKTGLKDLIAGVTPTLVDWTEDPTDAVDITDGDITTYCTTGNKVTGDGWQYAYFEWDLGTFYNIVTSFVGGTNVTTGETYTQLGFWDGAAWVTSPTSIVFARNNAVGVCNSGRCSKVRLGLTSSAAATVTPNIREFHVWRL